MSEVDLERFLSKNPLRTLSNESKFNPILVSDSKGCTLESLLEDNSPFVEFLCKRGGRTEECVDLLASELPRITKRHKKPPFVYIWTPLEIHTDQGSNFQSQLFSDVCRLFRITKTRTTPYHPSSNGQVERLNRTILQMIRCYVDSNQKNWDEDLPMLLAAYRSTPHQGTQLIPNKLMLGREVLQPYDVLSRDPLTLTETDNAYDYLQKLQDRLDFSHEATKMDQARQKRL